MNSVEDLQRYLRSLPPRSLECNFMHFTNESDFEHDKIVSKSLSYSVVEEFFIETNQYENLGIFSMGWNK